MNMFFVQATTKNGPVNFFVEVYLWQNKDDVIRKEARRRHIILCDDWICEKLSYSDANYALAA